MMKNLQVEICCSSMGEELKWRLADGVEDSTRLHGFLLVPSRPPPGHEFPHFSNVPSVTAGGFFKARHRGNPHNVLPGTVQSRSQGGFLDMKESPPPSHPQPSSSSSGTAFGRAFLGAVTDDARNSSAAYPSPQGSFPLPNCIPRGERLKGWY
ncbi:hypothetical protein TNCV_2294441 [Trichonephila clavipes]|nr:hypothetical protein TNCV_2294441 [Trichonephila clavipes]